MRVSANSNLIRESFDNYLRRGMIDNDVDPSKPLKKRRIPKYKFHTANCHKDDIFEDEVK